MGFNPALVIGVGGTGRWIATELRARLLGTAGVMADAQPADLGGVQLLSFDVDAENSYEFAGHRLADGETAFAVAAIADVINNIRDFPDGDPRARFDDFRDWISQEEAKAYDLALLNEFMDEGAGQMRQWGRLAIQMQPQFFNRVQQAVGTLAGRGQVDVYVVGSLCGGTGSAALFDAAAAVHAARNQTAPQTSMRLIGVFVLPAGLSREVDPKTQQWLQALSYATLRELERFQQAPETVQLRRDGTTLRLRNRLFDLCYLLDGVREQAGGDVRQNVVNTRAFYGVDAAAADLLYGYLNPGSSGELGTLVANAVNHISGHHPYKYSKFGIHTAHAPMLLAQRSLALDDSIAAVDLLLAPDAGGDPTSLVATPQVDFDDQSGVRRSAYNAKLFNIAGRYLNDRTVRPSKSAECLDWLTPADPTLKSKPPRKPDFANTDFPGIGKLKTPYQNPEVKAKVDSSVEALFIQMQTLIDNGRRPLLDSFRTYLLVQCQRFMTEPSRVGGLARGRRALAELAGTARQLRQRFQQLSEQEQRSGRLANAVARYKRAQDEMDDHRHWDDAKEQVDLFEAADRLIAARLDVLGQAAVIALVENLLDIIQGVLDQDIESWQRSLEAVRTDLNLASTDLDRCWDEHNQVVVRTSLLQRRSAIENQARELLTNQLKGQATPELHPHITSPAAGFVEQLNWNVGVAPTDGRDHLKLVGPWKESGLEIHPSDLVDALAERYDFVARQGIGEALAADSRGIDVAADAAASALIDNSSLLAATAPEKGAPPNPLPMEDLVVFGPWGDGTKGTATLKASLIKRGIKDTNFSDTTALAAANPKAAANVPLNHEAWILHWRHGVSVEAFGATEEMRQQYQRLREDDKPLHIFPEERAALAKELWSQQLIRDGRLHGATAEFGPQATGLARHDRFLRVLIQLAAHEKLEWRFDSVDQSGEWRLIVDDGAPLQITTGKEPRCLLDAIVGLMSDGEDVPATQRLIEQMDVSVKSIGASRGESAEKIRKACTGNLEPLFGFDTDGDLKLLMQLTAMELEGHS